MFKKRKQKNIVLRKTKMKKTVGDQEFQGVARGEHSKSQGASSEVSRQVGFACGCQGKAGQAQGAAGAREE